MTIHQKKETIRIRVVVRGLDRHALHDVLTHRLASNDGDGCCRRGRHVLLERFGTPSLRNPSARCGIKAGIAGDNQFKS